MPDHRRFITFPQVPQNSNNEILFYKRVIADYWKSTDPLCEEIVFDCGALKFIRPFGLNILALLIRSLLQDSKTVFFSHPTDRACKRYLENQGFYEEFPIQDSNSVVKAAPRSTSVGLRRMEFVEPSFFEQVALWLSRNLSLPAENIKNAIYLPLSELVPNVVDHSEFSIGCYISAQSYPRENRLMFSVADRGVGFLETLRHKYTNLNNDQEAVALAIESGISSKSKVRNAGRGLYLLCDFLKHCGNLEIISKDGVWRQNSNGTTSSQTMPFCFPGSCVNIEIDKQQIMDVRFQDEDD